VDGNFKIQLVSWIIAQGSHALVRWWMRRHVLCSLSCRQLTPQNSVETTSHSDHQRLRRDSWSRNLTIADRSRSASYNSLSGRKRQYRNNCPRTDHGSRECTGLSIGLFLVCFPFNFFLIVPCVRLSWLNVNFYCMLNTPYSTVSYRIVSWCRTVVTDLVHNACAFLRYRQRHCSQYRKWPYKVT